MFFKGKRIYLGLDIGTHTIKIIQLKKSGSLLQLVQVLAFPTPAEAFVDGDLVRPELISYALREQVRAYKLSAKNVIAVVPEKYVITRQVKMPLMPDEELAAALQWEVEKYIPLPGNDLVLDFVNLGLDQDGQGKENTVLLIAVPKKIIYPYCNLLVEAGLHPIAMETMPFALNRLSASIGAEGEEVSKLSTYLDMGAGGTTVIIFKEGVPEFSRTIPIGGNLMTQSIAQSFGLDQVQAEKLKLEKAEILNNDFNTSNDLDNTKIQLDLVLRPILTDLAREVRRCMDYWKLKSKGMEIDSFYLTGGMGLLKGLTGFMAEQLEVPIKRTNPASFLTNILDPETPQELLLKVNPGFSVALGLALREVVT